MVFHKTGSTVKALPCDHSCKQPALVMTSIVKPCLTCHLNSVIKSSHKRPQPLL